MSTSTRRSVLYSTSHEAQEAIAAKAAQEAIAAKAAEAGTTTMLYQWLYRSIFLFIESMLFVCRKCWLSLAPAAGNYFHYNVFLPFKNINCEKRYFISARHDVHLVMCMYVCVCVPRFGYESTGGSVSCADAVSG